MNTDKKPLQRQAGSPIGGETLSVKICVHLCSSVVSILYFNRKCRTQGEMKHLPAFRSLVP